MFTAVSLASEGERNVTLNREAYSLGQLVGGELLDRGDAEEALHAAGSAAGLADREVRATVKSGLDAGMKEPRGMPESVSGDADEVAHHPNGEEARLLETESGLAEQFIRDNGKDLRFCGLWIKWFVWDGKRWRVDSSGRVQRLLKRTLRKLRIASARDGNKGLVNWLFKAEARSTRDNVVALARYEEEVQVNPDDLDGHLMLLNCANGTVDLRTGKLRHHSREDLLTKLAPVAFDRGARCPLWEAFLDRIFDGDGDLIAFLKRAVGYSLTGDVGEQVLFVLWGSGANGKSTFLVTLLSLLGEYGKPGVSDLLLARKYEQHPTELADLFGARFVAFQEATEGQRFEESKVKALTGGDRIKARRMREDFWHYSPTHKLWLGTNHRPVIRGTDLAIWRRILLIPFDVTIPPTERDKQLPQKLKGECPGILRWAVEGCLEWQRDGLAPPKRVQAAIEEYRESEDQLGAFIADCCVLSSYAWAKSADLYAAFNVWAETNGEPAMSAKAFGQRLSERGFQRIPIGHNKDRGWKGIGLRTHADASSSSSPACARVEDKPEDVSASVRIQPDRDRTGAQRGEAGP
jgi:putative DNA primase/helicase